LSRLLSSLSPISGAFPVGGTSMCLHGWQFGVAVGVNCALGAFLSAGIGVYAPCVVLLALLGLHALGAYPIMMGTCGLVEPVASLRFFKNRPLCLGSVRRMAEWFMIVPQ
jgi:hypothetical protein